MSKRVDKYIQSLLGCCTDHTMTTIKPLHSFRTLLALICLALCLLPNAVRGEESVGEETLELFSAFEETSSAASRAPKPLSQTAENVTVITAAEIRLLNAHTLADILATIPGIQTEQLGGPGSLVFTRIQGSNPSHVRVLVDGVTINNFGDNFSDVSLVPAQIIERIEIIKGAASSSWGQALGGVINVITKSPDQRQIGGSATAFIGERATADTRAELSGTTGQLGYHLSGGYLGSDGFRTNTQLFSNYAYTKLLYELPEQGQLSATVRYNRANRGNFSNTLDPLPENQYKEDQDNQHLYTTLAYKQPLADHLNLELLAFHAFRKDNYVLSVLADNTFLGGNKIRESSTGGSAKLIWQGSNNLVVFGGEYERADMRNTDSYVNADLLNRDVDRWGVYLNDTITFGPVAVIPGVRFDQNGNDQFSPSLGATWQLSETTLLRGYSARGYSLPSLALDRPAEKVWTSQIGAESSAVPYLWLKGTLFRNETWNIQVYDWDTGVTHAERRITLGGEAEVRTIPVFNTSLGVGYNFSETTRPGESAPVIDTPRHTLHLGLNFDDHRMFRAALTGRHIFWNAEPTYNGKFSGILWDLHLGATLLKRKNTSLELFFSGHNLFNGSQYQDEVKPNSPRWFEGGVRVNF